MEQMLAAVDVGDVNGALSLSAPEGWKLPSYDLDVEGNPVKYGSTADAKATLEVMTAQLRKMNARLQSVITGFDCQATSTYAVCAADVVQTVTMPDGAQLPGSGRVTAAARKGNDGWKWTHWHMSLAQAAAPPPAPAAAPPPPPPVLPLAAMNTKELVWKDAPNMPGVQQALLWENPATRESAVFMKVAKAMKMPRHYHSNATHGYIVKGGITVTDETGKPHDVTQGGWYYEPSKVIHATDVKAGTLVLHIASGGPFDTVMVDDKGNPIPATPAAPTAETKAPPSTTATPTKPGTATPAPGAAATTPAAATPALKSPNLGPAPVAPAPGAPPTASPATPASFSK